MSLSTIQTGYKPEFGLGALYQGFNSGNADQSAQEELIKQFLANQRSQQMNPLEAQTAQQNLDINQHKTDPRYTEALTNTQIGQSMSSMAAGETAQGLQQFKQRAGQGELENQITRQDKQSQVDQFDSLIQTEANPLQRMALIKAREQVLGMLKETPEFVGKRELKETGTESAEYQTEIRLANARENASMKLQLQLEQEKKRAEQLMDLYRIIANPNASPEQKKYAQQVIQLHTTEQMGKNPNAYKEQIDKKQFGLDISPAPINQAGGAPQGGGLEAAIMAEIERRKQQK